MNCYDCNAKAHCIAVAQPGSVVCMVNRMRYGGSHADDKPPRQPGDFCQYCGQRLRTIGTARFCNNVSCKNRFEDRVDFIGDPNIQNLIDTMRKRLCSQADPETRAYAEDFKTALHEVQPEISDVLVPNCVYRCGCPEMQTCGMYEWWLKFHPDIASTDIQKRYNTYNELFWKVREKRGRK